ncbi:Uncharacterized protein FKW44_009765, partial [Caligus rogercresseyi]
NYAEKESGRVVVYLTTLGVIRETWARCFEVRKILRTLMVKAEEKDVFMSRTHQIELMETNANIKDSTTSSLPGGNIPWCESGCVCVDAF